MPAATRGAQRRDPRWWTPERLPPALAECRSGPAPGETVGLLDLDLAPIAGATRVVRQYHRTPLYVLRPIHLDAARPGMAFLYLQQHGDGLVQGDRYRIDVHVAAGGEAHLTTQAATKIYRMPGGYATQLVNLTAEAGSLLEYLPDPVIPFRGSRFYGATTVTADPTATVLLAETLLPGRLAAGECHDYDFFCAATRIRRPDGRQVAVDTLAFGAADGPAQSPARLGRHLVHAAFYALADGGTLDGLDRSLLAALAECPEVLTGVGLLPYDAGLVVRILGPSSLPVRSALHTAWDTARRHLTGAPAPDLRKG
ncbi:urease accessory protein UreD [Geodermatophilus sp. TF02-6]|uniref:urease accessory protein UreD n=1 Tax=Geodermatophilus sp. TF02-6 TaxID=2250575 RepID=UPI000DEB055A|nr:urease accessory protein UreD [Geodermatophilus sp. TF02-6]RBY83791.1 urease accessory protein UreD [Geodermatophilus sp. TF02-6]